MIEPAGETISSAIARVYWRALVGNVVALIEDAALLLEQSPARARSLLILAQEETGKAHRLYRAAERAWSDGTGTVDLPPDFRRLERHHESKIAASLGFGEELASFWGDYSELERLGNMTGEEFVEHLQMTRASRAESARTINGQKQAGFYVDRVGDTVVSPQDVDAGDLTDALTRTAQVVEMLLIGDHSQMKLHSPERYDSTYELQQRLLPFSHPEDCLAAEDADGP